MSWWNQIDIYWELTAWASALLGPILSVLTIIWILLTKKNAVSAVAWCLLVLFLPLLGPLLYLLFGYQHITRPLNRKRRHKNLFQRRHPPLVTSSPDALVTDAAGEPEEQSGSSWQAVDRLARRFGAFPVAPGNQLVFFHEGQPAFESMLDAVRSAQHHIHLETFIFQPDSIGQRFLEELTRAACRGVEVRLLTDAMGTYRLGALRLRPFRRAGGKFSMFLPLNPLRRRIQINMRNHRKILLVDGKVAFTGGLNVGDEYLGQNPRFGYWRDTHLRIEGPAVPALQRVFAEDWDFAAGENLHHATYFPQELARGPYPVQVIESGPDREQKAIREVYFAAMLRARRRLWIASPYFVPDPGLLDALCLAGYLGLDVRLLCQYHPDKWIPYFAARYYFNDILGAGVKVYQYTRGMMHSKVVLVDREWASVGTANLDNRSMHLNFEVNCLIYSPEAVAELEAAFQRDLESAVRLDRHVFLHRPFAARVLDNACRLLSPVL